MRQYSQLVFFFFFTIIENYSKYLNFYIYKGKSFFFSSKQEESCTITIRVKKHCREKHALVDSRERRDNPATNG